MGRMKNEVLCEMLKSDVKIISQKLKKEGEILGNHVYEAIEIITTQNQEKIRAEKKGMIFYKDFEKWHDVEKEAPDDDSLRVLIKLDDGDCGIGVYRDGKWVGIETCGSAGNSVPRKKRIILWRYILPEDENVVNAELNKYFAPLDETLPLLQFLASINYKKIIQEDESYIEEHWREKYDGKLVAISANELCKKNICSNTYDIFCKILKTYSWKTLNTVALVYTIGSFASEEGDEIDNYEELKSFFEDPSYFEPFAEYDKYIVEYLAPKLITHPESLRTAMRHIER